MTEQNLQDHLGQLFSDIPSHPEEAETQAEPQVERLSPEDAIIFGLLGDEPVPIPAAAEHVMAEAPLPVPPGPEGAGEQETLPASAPAGESAPGERRARILRALLYGVIFLGVAPPIILLVNLAWQKQTNVPGLSVCLAFYTLAVAVTFVQWLFNSSLTKTLRETEGERDEALSSRAPLEGRVHTLAAANASLQRSEFQFQAVLQIATDVTTVLDQEQLLHRVVNVIRDRFDLYHVSLFLLDESSEWAVLRAGTGEAGGQMLAQGYRLGVDDASLVGRCIIDTQARIALDAAGQAQLLYGDDPNQPDENGVHPVRKVDVVEPNSLLPKTRSEMVLPLSLGDRVIGALALHSARLDALSEPDIPIFQMLADQVTVAIENAQAFTEMRASVDELERSLAHKQQARLAPVRSIPLYERTRAGTQSPDGPLSSDAELAIAQRKLIVRSGADDGEKPPVLVAPIALRDEIIGALGLQDVEGDRRWTDDEIALIEAVADQMALAIENARLIEDTRRRAERERLLAEISARVRASTDVDTILRTAVLELGRALRASDGLIHLGTGNEADAGGPQAYN